MQYFVVYLLLGAILSVIMFMTSKTPLPIKREIVAHTAIALFWPIVLINVGRLLVKPTEDIDEEN